MMTKKLIVGLLLVALAALIVPAPLALEAGGEVRIKTQVRLAHWDIWLHADGRTWQDTGAPGDARSYVFDVTPPEIRGYTNLRYEMVAGVNREQFMAAGGRSGHAPDADGWDDFEKDILGHTPDNYRVIGENQVGFTLSPLSRAERITKEWQAELVQGLRWYLPAVVYWYGTPTEGLPDFAVTSLSGGTSTTELGVPYTGTVVYTLKDAEGPVEAILRLTHNGFPLSTPAGERIHDQVITFTPGETRTFQFRFTGQASDSDLRAEIWPTQPANKSQEQRDAAPGDNVSDRIIPRREVPRPAGGNCCKDGPAPMGINEPAPVSDSSTRYIFTHTTYELEYIAICVNIDSPEVVRGDTVNGRFQFVAYQRDHYDIEVYTMIDPGCGGWGGDPKTGAGGCPGWPPSFAWLPAGSMSHRFMIDMPFAITASLGNTAISPATGQRREGRHSFTWRTTNTTSTVINNFTLTVTAPDGQTWTCTDACTVFLPRGITLSEIFFMNDHVYRYNKQTAFVRITNARDVGEERVTLNYRLNGSIVKTETIMLPSGPTGSSKGFLRAFEYTPMAWENTLSVDASAPGLPRAYTAETRRALTATRSKFINAEIVRAVDLPRLEDREATTRNLPVVYHHTTAAQNRTHNNGKVMPAVNYNVYTWTATTRNYRESVDIAVKIDSWQATPGKGRGAWEIMPLFGDQAYRTVRAGTGFELIINTDYSHNFGSNPPNSRVASAVDSSSYTSRSMSLGVDPLGVARVFGAFPYANWITSVAVQNNRDYIVGHKGLNRGETTELEPTEGEEGDYSIKWEYPEHSHTGETYTFRARTHRIDKFYPDSYPDTFDRAVAAYRRANNADVEWKTQHDDRYRFFVFIGVAGVSNLLTVHEDYVFIYGSFFNDIVMRRPRSWSTTPD